MTSSRARSYVKLWGCVQGRSWPGICAYNRQRTASKKCKGLAYENRSTISRFVHNPDSAYGSMVIPEKRSNRSTGFLCSSRGIIERGLFMARDVSPLPNVPFSKAMRRVVYQLIRADYRRQPGLYTSYPPTRVYDLGQTYRMLFPALYPWFLYFSKNMAAGCKLDFLRDCSIEDGPRAVHKRRIHRPR